MSSCAGVLQGSGIQVLAGGKIILGGVDIDVHKGEVLGLIGPNGAGKTTLMRALAGVLVPDQGAITIDGIDAMQMNRQVRARRVAYLPQDTTVSWPLSVASVVALGRMPHRNSFAALASDDQRAIELALMRTETDGLLTRSIGTLSGGERMRVMVARMLAVEADVLLADEPVAALDPYFQLEFMDLFAEEAARGRGVVLVLHDLVLASRYCHRLLVLDQGDKVADGIPADVLNDELLEQVYRIEALSGTHENTRYVVPWRRRLK